MDTFLTKRAPSTSSFDRSRSIERLERRSNTSWKRYDDSPDRRSVSPPYKSRDSKRYEKSSADRKRRSNSPYDRYDKSSTRRDRTSSLRMHTKSPRYSDSVITGTAPEPVSPIYRKPRLRESRSEKYNRKDDDRLYDDEDRYRAKERRYWKNEDRYYEDDDSYLKEDSGRRREDSDDDDRDRKEDRKSSSRPSLAKPNLSRRSSNFRMQLYHELNVVDRAKDSKGKKALYSRSHDSSRSKRSSLRDQSPSRKVSYSCPAKTNRFERSEPIAMCSGRRWDDDDREYTRKRHERKIDESLFDRSDDDEVFALDIEPLPKSRR